MFLELVSLSNEFVSQSAKRCRGSVLTDDYHTFLLLQHRFPPMGGEHAIAVPIVIANVWRIWAFAKPHRQLSHTEHESWRSRCGIRYREWRDKIYWCLDYLGLRHCLSCWGLVKQCWQEVLDDDSSTSPPHQVALTQNLVQHNAQELLLTKSANRQGNVTNCYINLPFLPSKVFLQWLQISKSITTWPMVLNHAQDTSRYKLRGHITSYSPA